MKVLVGGTFDRLHKGHLELLKAAKRLGDVTVGLTTDEFVKKSRKQKKSLILPYEKRKKELIAAGFKHIVPIVGYEGDAIDPKYEAVVFTKETRTNTEKLNEKRIEAGVPPLLLVEVPLVMAEDKRPISSTRIRLGIITRAGKLKAIKPITKNKVRLGIIDLIEKHGEMYGYQLHKIYEKEIGPISLRLLYYHLAKGIKEGLFEVTVREEEKGCSWGGKVERKYYSLSLKPKEYNR